MLQDHLPNLTDDVASAQIVSGATIYRDRWSIPHIYAENAHDAFFAQGYATAQDRLWQMDFDRLRCLGRAAEYLGPSAITEDTLMRRRDFETVSRADYDLCSTDAKVALDAYAEGVNAFINSNDALPYEYELLRVEPEPWEPWHCIVVYKVRNSAEGGFQSKLWRAELAAKIGPEKAAKLSPGYQQGMYLTVPPGVVYDGPAENAVDELRATVNATAPLREIDGGSNGWAVSGDLTASGIPMVGGDSHRGLEVPNVYYQVHMRTDEFDVLGHSVPGMPMVMHFSHNRHVAWGMTHGGVDTQDLFVEQLRRANDGVEYLFKGEWLVAETSRQQLRVRGDATQTIEAIKTHHGPIISGSADDGWGIALADPGSNGATPWVDATLDAMKCKNADEFEQALSRWTDRVNNYPYADIHGSFGYALKGRIPIRNAVNGWGPVEGWTGENEWQGYIPDDELPRSRNPETGWAVTCNQRVVGEDYPYFLSGSFGSDYRARRIISHIEEAKANGHLLRIEDMAAFHGDVGTVPGMKLIKRLRALDADALPNDTSKEASKAALDILLEWDGKLNADSIGAVVYSALNDEISLALMERNYGIDPNEFAANPDLNAVDHLRRQLKPAFINAINQGGGQEFLAPHESVDTFLGTCLTNAANHLESTYGELDAVTWSDVHITKQVHPLSAVFPEAADKLDAPAIGTAGDGDVPFATGSRPAWNFRTGSGPVNRYLHDPATWSAGRWIVPLGVSGNVASHHRHDQQHSWATIAGIPQLFEWDEIAKTATTIQNLQPAQ
ncbi:MAG: penicillin acylase family protein [Chloroflexi bacterium]|nr:penicillin acylase family protein [Chloroflexota bacterium]MYK61752.1 penicillin acylase family protein [Chloroflexota bacterium]